MYPQPSQTGQWNPNSPQTAAPNQSPPQSSAQQQQHQQQPPPPSQQQQQQQWAPSPGSQQSPPNGQYARPPNQMPPLAPGAQGPPPHMAPLQPHPDYRSLPPMYSHSPYHPQPQMPYPHQPAPRQRTAIACRYCRRRKIRCSGFDQSEDGRCTNCQRFQQECVFTPVNQQSQAFVPAHAVLNRQGAMPTQFYGAFGQPIAPPYHYAQYGPPNGYSQYPPPQMQPGQPMHQQPMPTDPQGHPHQYQEPPQLAGQKRPNEEDHTPTATPVNPALAAQQAVQAEQQSAEAPSDATASQPAAESSTDTQDPQPETATDEAEESVKEPKIELDDKPAANGYPAPTSDADIRPPSSQEATA